MEIGKLLVFAGLAIAVVGAMIWLSGSRGGFLPGDISVRKENFSFHFPIVTCLVVSAVLTLLLHLFRR